MSEILKKIGVAFLVLGVIASIYLAYVSGNTLHGRNWLSTIITFVICIISFGLSSVFILAFAEVLDRLESIEYYLQAKEEKVAREKVEREKVESNNYWRCNNCGKANPPYVGTCGCGSRKPEA